jgi:hypothetical protein
MPPNEVGAVNNTDKIVGEGAPNDQVTISGS